MVMHVFTLKLFPYTFVLVPGLRTPHSLKVSHSDLISKIKKFCF